MDKHIVWLSHAHIISKMRKINVYFRPVAANKHTCNMYVEGDALTLL